MTRDEIVRADQSGGGMFAVIPSVVMADSDLPQSARMLYGVITWKCNETAYCWASNRALGEILGLSAKRISVLLSALEEKGHIEMEVIRDPVTGQVLQRYIYPIMKSSREQRHRSQADAPPPPENRDTPPHFQGDPSPISGGGIPENGKEKHKEETKSNPPYSPPTGDKQEAKEPTPKKSKYALQEDAKPLLREYVGNDNVLARKLADFIEMRTQLRAVNSKTGIQALLKKLDRLSGGNRDLKLLLIDEAMANSWKSVFPLKSQGRDSPPRPGPAQPPKRSFHKEIIDGEEVFVYDDEPS